MLSTDLSTIGATGLLIFCVFACLYVIIRQKASEKYLESAAEYVKNENKKAVSLRRMAEVEATLTDLTDSYNSLLTSHKRLRSRIGMRKVRETANSGTDTLDLAASTDKDAIRKRLRETGQLR